MKIAIHHRKGSFSDRWIEYCKKKSIEYKIVNAYHSNIIEQINDCDVFMWHYHQGYVKDTLAAQPILFALEHAGIKVFPDFNTAWHFDDKVSQKYLLEAIEAPLVPSYVFYNKKEALDWTNLTTFPKVFKLRGGAGSSNVKLIKTKQECIQLIDKAFGRGIKRFDGKAYFLDTFKKYRSDLKTTFDVLKAFGRIFISTKYSKHAGREKGYVYFQDFIPNNIFDIRVIIIGEKAFAVKRMVRKNDFRASGSGSAVYEREAIDIRCIEIAYEVNEKIQAESIGFDFVFNKDGEPMIVEIGYGFAIEFYDSCPGYWDKNIKWHKGNFIPQEWMLDDIMK